MANDSWRTPEDLIQTVKEFYGGTIDTDPASSSEANDYINATVFYDEVFNGLINIWTGNVFCNPPYSRGKVLKFLKKGMKEIELKHTDQLLLLTNLDPSTAWGRLATYKATRMLLFGKRLSFIDPSTSKPATDNSRCQVLYYFGKNTKRFRIFFEQYGVITKPLRHSNDGLVM